MIQSEIEGQPYVSGMLTVNFYDIKSDKEVYSKEYKFLTKVDTSNPNLTGQLSYFLPYSDYRAVIAAKDVNKGGNYDSAKFSFILEKIPEDSYGLSDIQLANSINKSENEESPFYKNTYEIVPNPSILYGETSPVVFYYAELYNLNAGTNPEQLKLRRIVLNSKKEEMYNREKIVPRVNKSIVEVGTINVHKFPTGLYTFVLALLDTLNNTNYIKSKSFYVYNSHIKDTTTTTFSDAEFISSEFAFLGENELNEAFAIAKYIATNVEIEQWNKLTEIEGKQTFMFNFWKNRDLTPGTVENEFKRDYYKRVSYANEAFSSFNRKGWTTDRGRVYITYGNPSEINRYPSQVDTKPYEIWNYDELEGGVIFVFADLSGFGDYRMMHSSKRGELRDDDWMRRIQAL